MSEPLTQHAALAGAGAELATHPAPTRSIRRRQIHLDFHNAADIGKLGEFFDPTQFAQTLADAYVDSVNLFAKCHHGYAYYPTSVGTQHPGLAFDLLGQQIEALHAQGIRAPIYVSVMWDDLAGILHPEWITISRSGQALMRHPLEHGSPLDNEVGWTTVDLASGYADYLYTMVEELCDKYPVDGFWFDIVWAEPNFAPWAQERARSKGVDLSDERAVRDLAEADLHFFLGRIRDLIRSKVPDASIFFNGTVDGHAAAVAQYQTHFEIESLPTSNGVWGYMHYPVSVRHIRTLGLPTVGMTGRFHKSWADFGGLKPVHQLEYESGTILSGGSAISVGDQLDPSGVLDPAVYKTIGHVYERVQALEPWLHTARPVAEIAVLKDVQTELEGMHVSGTYTEEVQGAAQMLLDLHMQFAIVEPAADDLDSYKLIVVPDGLIGTPDLQLALERARLAGSKIVISGRGGADPATGGLGPLEAPAEILGTTEVSPSYVRPDRPGTRFPGLHLGYDYVFYDEAYLLHATDERADGWGQLSAARYERRWDHFTSHAHAPVGAPLDSPWAVVGHDIAMLATPLFGAYRRHDYWAYKALFSSLLDHFLPEPALVFEGPAWIEVALLCDEGTSADRAPVVVHLTAFTPRRGYSPVPRVDEGVQFSGTELTLARAHRPEAVYIAPDGVGVPWSWDTGRLRIHLPPIGTHTVLVVE